MFRCSDFTREQQSQVALLLALRFMASAASLLVVPYLMLMLTRDMALSAMAAAVIASLVFVAGRLFASPIGRMADRWPRRRLMPVTLLAGAFSAGLLAWSPKHAGLSAAVPACIGLSIAGAAFQLLNRTHIARSFPKGGLTRVYSGSSAAYNLGMLAGTAAGGLWAFSRDGAGLPEAAALAYLAAALLALLLAPVPAGADDATTHGSTARNLPVPRGPALRAFAVAAGVLGYLSTTVYLSLAIYCARVFGHSAYTSVFFVAQSAALIVALPVIGVRIKAHPPEQLAQLYFGGLLLAAVGFTAFSLVPADHGAIASGVLAVFFCVSQCLAIPSADSLLAATFDHQVLGRVFGTTISGGAVGNALACLVNGVALDQLDTEQLYWLWATPGVVGGIVLLVAYRCCVMARRAQVANLDVVEPCPLETTVS
ncbi:MFS transporter [Piscinibacter sp.]|uniref:MFS transporter n=1 Tax=Piscinibacter sp. TaxID=1903157 RepID=UPI0039E6DFD3